MCFVVVVVRGDNISLHACESCLCVCAVCYVCVWCEKLQQQRRRRGEEEKTMRRCCATASECCCWTVWCGVSRRAGEGEGGGWSGVK